METSEPASTRADLLPPDSATEEPAQIVPPVVVVVVTSNPGPWLDELLAAVAAQDYPAVSVLVVDNASTDDVTPRIAAGLPRAFVRRCLDDRGFAAAANEALGSVEGAVFLLFCHDDVVPDPDALRVMVEEAYRSNAGIVGPKLVAHAHPERLLEVGMAIDHYGVSFSGIEPGEVDQEQHDAVRDVFFISHAAMLVRADLFRELGGFDAETFPGSDDIDLCWRARLAGARVVVAPSARVRHLRATLSEARPARDRDPHDLRAETRGRVRMLCKSYSALALVWVLPTAFILICAEAAALAVTGRAGRVRGLFFGWFSAFRRPAELRRARAETQRLRQVDDGDVRDLMIRGSARFRTFLMQRLHPGERLADVSNRTRERMEEAARQLRRIPALVTIALVVLVAFGSRSLFAGRVPEIGMFRAWPDVGTAWATFTAPWRASMMGSPHPATPAFGFIAALSALLFGHEGLARSLLVGGALPLGIFGTFRIIRPLTTSLFAPVAAAVAYGANPVARNAIGRGELGALVCFALAPFVFGALVRIVGDSVDRRDRAHLVITIAFLAAVATSVWPPAILLAPLIAFAWVAAVPFVGEPRVALRGLAYALGAAFFGVALLAPWSFSLLGADASTLGAQPRVPLSPGDLLRFHTGTAGAGFAPWGIIAAAAVPLLIATGPRLVWAARAWMLAIASFVLAWLPTRISVDAPVPAADAVLVGAALGLAIAVGLGAAALFDDLRKFRFGWRQILIGVTTLGIAASMLGLAADSWSGRFRLASDDWPSTFSWMRDAAATGNFRVLWLGDPTVLPVDAKLSGRTGFALTRDGPGDATALWAAPEGDADRAVGRAIRAAESGATARLGHLLAPAGVRLIAFVNRAASGGGARGRALDGLGAALARQLDLTLSRVGPSGVVYQSDAFVPVHALIPPGANALPVDASDPVSALARADVASVAGVGTKGSRTAAVGPGTLLWSEAANPNWRATVGQRVLARRDAFGSTNAFALDEHASVTVRYRGGAVSGALRTIGLIGWVIAIATWIVTRRRSRAQRGAA